MALTSNGNTMRQFLTNCSRCMSQTIFTITDVVCDKYFLSAEIGLRICVCFWCICVIFFQCRNRYIYIFFVCVRYLASLWGGQADPMGHPCMCWCIWTFVCEIWLSLWASHVCVCFFCVYVFVCVCVIFGIAVYSLAFDI